MSEPDAVWDVGLQLERTGLAWRRLGLGFLGVGLVLPRVTAARLGPWSLPAAALALLTGVLLLALVHRRYALAHLNLTSENTPRTGGRLPLTLTLVTLVVAVTALAALVL